MDWTCAHRNRYRLRHCRTPVDRKQLERAGDHQGATPVDPERAVRPCSPSYLLRISAGFAGNGIGARRAARPSRFRAGYPGLGTQTAYRRSFSLTAIRRGISGLQAAGESAGSLRGLGGAAERKTRMLESRLDGDLSWNLRSQAYARLWPASCGSARPKKLQFWPGRWCAE